MNKLRGSGKYKCFFQSTTFITILLILTCLNLLNAQSPNKNSSTGKISGIIVDGQTNLPIEAVNFVLTEIRDSTKILGTATDKDGKFELSNIPFGFYNARISYIGYKIRSRKGIVLNNKISEIKLDTIKIIPRTYSTADVQITGEKERTVREKDKIIFRPDRELGNNALELLENTPMVSVDVDDNIKIMGKNAVIYIDGVPAKNMGIHEARDLKMYSVSEIEKFELINDPNPDFMEATDGGIINIITKKTINTRYSGSVDLGANTNNQFDGITNFNYIFKGVSLTGNYNKEFSNYTRDNSSVKTLAFGSELNTYEQTGKNENKGNNDNFRLNLSLNSDRNNMFFYNSSYKVQNTDNAIDLENQIYNAGGNIINDIESKSLVHTNQKFLNNTINYSKRFGKIGQFLMINLTHMYNKMDKENNLTQLGSYSLAGKSNTSSLNHDNSSNSNNNLSLRVQYFYPLDSTSRFSIALTSNYLKLSMNDNYFSYDPGQQFYIEKQNQKINQGYSDFRNGLNCMFNTQFIGLRYILGANFESKITDNNDEVKGNSFTTRFSSVTPLITISKNFTQSSSISIRYSNMVMYPQNRQLSPYSNFTDSSNIVTGNLDLKPYSTNNYVLGYSYMGNLETPLALIIRAVKSDATDIIEQVTTVENSKITRTTYKNVAKSKNYTFGVFANAAIFKSVVIFSDFAVVNKKYEGLQKSYEGTNWNWFLNTSWKANDFRVQLDLNYSSPSYSSQTKTEAVFYSNLALKALFFDKNLALTFKVADIFNSRNSNSVNSGTGFNFINKVSETTRVFSFNVSYFFRSQAKDDFEERMKDAYDDDF